jgi:hypothetical protein
MSKARGFQQGMSFFFSTTRVGGLETICVERRTQATLRVLFGHRCIVQIKTGHWSLVIGHWSLVIEKTLTYYPIPITNP